MVRANEKERERERERQRERERERETETEKEREMSMANKLMRQTKIYVFHRSLTLTSIEWKN